MGEASSPALGPPCPSRPAQSCHSHPSSVPAPCSRSAGAAAFARVNSLIFLGLVVALAAAIGSVWLQRTAKTIVPDLGALPYTPADAGMGGLAAEYRPWAWDAPCTARAGGGATWCLVNGTGRYGMRHTMLPSPVRSGQCDVHPHSTQGTLCDLPRVFAFVFPAVVGMMEGANLSGDLADPGHSIPRGTLGAVSTAFICYVLLILGQARAPPRQPRIRCARRPAAATAREGGGLCPSVLVGSAAKSAAPERERERA